MTALMFNPPTLCDLCFSANIFVNQAMRRCITIIIFLEMGRKKLAMTAEERKAHVRKLAAKRQQKRRANMSKEEKKKSKKSMYSSSILQMTLAQNP